MSLGGFAPVLYGIQQFGIDPGKAGQVLGIQLVGFALIGVDQLHLARVGNQHFVAAFFEQTARPG
jgi:hypothetical protein